MFARELLYSVVPFPAKRNPRAETPLDQIDRPLCVRPVIEETMITGSIIPRGARASKACMRWGCVGEDGAGRGVVGAISEARPLEPTGWLAGCEASCELSERA